MKLLNLINKEYYRRQTNFSYRNNWQRLHLDLPLLGTIIILVALGLVILYSASNQNEDMMIRQAVRLGLAFSVMVFFSQISPHKYKMWTPWVYSAGIVLLMVVLVIGRIGKGAQRWLDLGVIHFQPSEVMKIAVPMIVAWFLNTRNMPPKISALLITMILVTIPGLLIAKQPDLGTALLVILSGASILIFAGLGWHIITTVIILAGVSCPILWHYLHDYQRQRVLTFINPEMDPLGSGYHIIQSKIAIGSGGLFGKGWLNGTQSHLHFLPEHATDFIFAVCGEEFGLFGSTILITAIMLVVFRCLYIASQAQDPYSRLLAAGITSSFFLAIFVNIGMVTGLLPVVGVPLPLVSYGGTSIVTLFAGFGILMAIHTNRGIFKG